MQKFTLFFPILFLVNFHDYFHVASANEYLYYMCSSAGNYTENSTYRSNLANLFTALSTETVAVKGFGKNTSGALPDQISGLVLCRGDVNSSVCASCLNQSFTDIQTLCPYAKEATVWYDFCLLRYSNTDFLGSTDNSQQVILWNARNLTSKRFSGWNPPDSAIKLYFKAMMRTLLGSVAYRAAYTSTKRFGIGDINITSTVPVIIYSMLQCTPDMASDACHACLQDLTIKMVDKFDGRQGGRILGVRCSVRYEVFNFFLGHQGVLPLGVISAPAMPNPSAPSAAPLRGNMATPAPSANPGVPSYLPTLPPSIATVPFGTNKGGIRNLIIIINVIAALLLSCFVIVFCWIRKQSYAEIKISPKETRLVSRRQISNTWSWSRERGSDFTFFEFDQIAKATHDFSFGNKLGHGGFGTVYKGVLQDGIELAVKRLSAQSGQGIVEFKNEIQLIAKLQHRNLVRLLGWCIHGEENLLVYEFMPNKSLDTFIFDKKRGEQLKWEKRFEIIEGIAQGLLYLHKHSRLRVVHRDLKASNILLDSEMNPKISDFGLARIFDPKELQVITSRVVGTYGYMAPEYASEGIFSVKSDVFSFGVLILETVSGKRNMGFHQHGDFLNLLGYAWDRWNAGKSFELISPILTEASEKQLERCIHVGLLCVQENPMDRPVISDVIAYLSNASMILPEPKPPAYFNIRVTKEEGNETCYSDGTSRSINYITMTNPEGR